MQFGPQFSSNNNNNNNNKKDALNDVNCGRKWIKCHDDGDAIIFDGAAAVASASVDDEPMDMGFESGEVDSSATMCVLNRVEFSRNGPRTWVILVNIPRQAAEAFIYL